MAKGIRCDVAFLPLVLSQAKGARTTPISFAMSTRLDPWIPAFAGKTGGGFARPEPVEGPVPS